MTLTVLAVVAVTLLACRYVRGPKCMSYCQLKRWQYNRAKQQLKELTTRSGSVTILTVQDKTTEELSKIYKSISQWRCTSLPEEDQWMINSRKQLADIIAERQLLEI